ncbi:MAG TPA: hypothetical protein VK815_01200 [Candidatus Acidoferrales bacterium]|nr:hypothetical protein [Candidatus Acidoferrales bacterium]
MRTGEDFLGVGQPLSNRGWQDGGVKVENEKRKAGKRESGNLMRGRGLPGSERGSVAGESARGQPQSETLARLLGVRRLARLPADDGKAVSPLRSATAVQICGGLTEATGLDGQFLKGVKLRNKAKFENAKRSVVIGWNAENGRKKRTQMNPIQTHLKPIFTSAKPKERGEENSD